MGHLMTPSKQKSSRYVDQFSIVIKNSMQPQAEALVKADEQRKSWIYMVIFSKA